MFSNNIAELKAVSQNLMHSSIRTTDAIYGILTNDDVKMRIVSISKNGAEKEKQTMRDLLEQTKQLIKQLEDNQ